MLWPMTTELAGPTFLLERFVCARCGAFAHQRWINLEVRHTSRQGSNWRIYADDSRAFYVDGAQFYAGEGGRHEWRVSHCVSCDQGSVWRQNAMVFPLASGGPLPHPEMPSDVLELYEEARNVLPISRRASAALARAALERFLRSQEGADPKSRLDELIGELSGTVTQSLWKLLTGLRVIGNTSLHGDDGEPNEIVALFLEGDASQVVEPFFGAINALVEELITQPRKADELYAMIPQAKREAAERKALPAE